MIEVSSREHILGSKSDRVVRGINACQWLEGSQSRWEYDGRNRDEDARPVDRLESIIIEGQSLEGHGIECSPFVMLSTLFFTGVYFTDGDYGKGLPVTASVHGRLRQYSIVRPQRLTSTTQSLQ
jgi:hypothetical protein